jgi:gliding motility-associated lipoprotein GldK
VKFGQKFDDALKKSFMYTKMRVPFMPIVLGLVAILLLPSCGLFKKKGMASDKSNRKGEVTGAIDRKPWVQKLPIDMVPIQGGTFWMGQSDEDIAFTNSSDNKQITISEFYMDKYEVSNNKYRQFLQAVEDPNKSLITNTNAPETAMQAPKFDIATLKPDTTLWKKSYAYHYGDPLMDFYFDHPAFDNYPVVGVSYDQAMKYCEWRTYHMRANDDQEFDMPDFRLPTEAEWEYAAKGGIQQAKYPWGGPYVKNSRGCLQANFKPGRGNYTDDGFAYSAPVDVFEPNGFGLYNMSGNVAEWVLDAYKSSAYASTWDLNPIYLNKNEKRKVVRGGSWKDISHYLETSTRTYEYQNQGQSHIGFRTAMAFIGRSASMDAKLNKRIRR